jgi:hypothetical protein
MTTATRRDPRWLAAIALVLAAACSDVGDDVFAPTEPVDESLLAPPPAGQGLQFGTADVEVPLGTEAQDCYFFKVAELARAAGLDATRPLNLHRVQVAQRAGTHHMNIFRVKTVLKLGPDGGLLQKGTNGAGECFKSGNWADWPLIANSQEKGSFDWTFPEGVANILQPEEWLMLQTHYVNASTQMTMSTGRVRVNFWSIPDAAVTAELGTVFATKQSIRICSSNPAPVFQGSCQFNSPQPVHVIAANGHFHSRGRLFDMYSWSGTTPATPPAADRFYQSTRWDEPPMMHSPELDVAVPAHGGVWYTCAFQWRAPDPSIGCGGLDRFDHDKYMTPAENVDCCYTFGPIVELNEHCNAFVYYYPKQDDVNCF